MAPNSKSNSNYSKVEDSKYRINLTKDMASLGHLEQLRMNKKGQSNTVSQLGHRLMHELKHRGNGVQYNTQFSNSKLNKLFIDRIKYDKTIGNIVNKHKIRLNDRTIDLHKPNITFNPNVKSFQSNGGKIGKNLNSKIKHGDQGVNRNKYTEGKDED